MTAGLPLAFGCALALWCGPASATTRGSSPARAPRAPVLIVALPHLGSISYRCDSTAPRLAARFTAAPMSATDQVGVRERGRLIAHSLVQPSDPRVAAPHALITPFGRYRQLDWYITQNTEPHLIVARVRLTFAFAGARHQGLRRPLCGLSSWSASVSTESHSGPG